MSTRRQRLNLDRAAAGTLARSFWAPCLLVLLAACGDETPSTGTGTTAGTPGQVSAAQAPDDWSPPASGDAEPVLSAEDAIADVEKMLGQPASLRNEAWGRTVRRVTQILWPIATGETPPEGARMHEQLAQIVGGMAIELDKDPLLGESLEDDRKIEYEIHNAYRQMLEKSPDEFRTFFESKAPELLRSLAAARQARFFGPK